MDHKRIEYLDLEISHKQKHISSIDNNKITCSFPSYFRHCFHTEDNNLNICNTIIDLIINLGQSLDKNLESNNRICQSILDSLRQKNTDLKEIKDLIKTILSLKNTNFNQEIKTLIIQVHKEQIKFLQELKEFIKN